MPAIHYTPSKYIQADELLTGEYNFSRSSVLEAVNQVSICKGNIVETARDIAGESGVVILAAGRSERMNELKAFLPFDETLCFIQRIVKTYSDWGCGEIVVVTNQESFLQMKEKALISSKIKIIVNDHPEFERFYSVKLGLGAVASSSWCFIQNVDNPFIDPQILDFLYDHRSTENNIVPFYNDKGGHPVLLNRKNRERILRWKDNSANFREVLSSMECLRLEMPDEKVLININNPLEYKKFFNFC